MAVTGKNGNHACQILRRLSEKHFSAGKFIYRPSGSYGGKTKHVTFDDVLPLIMVLPGRMARVIRVQCANILDRYLSGDTTLHNEIQANKEMGKQKSYSMFADHVLGDTKQNLEGIPDTAYIYATYSEAFPGLVKIGRSRNVKARLSSGNTFIAPAPHRELCSAPTFNAKRDEAIAHAFFAQFSKEGEFFEISHDEVKSYFKTIAANYGEEYMYLLTRDEDSP
jgi:hypothetical protein